MCDTGAIEIERIKMLERRTRTRGVLFDSRDPSGSPYDFAKTVLHREGKKHILVETETSKLELTVLTANAQTEILGLSFWRGNDPEHEKVLLARPEALVTSVGASILIAVPGEDAHLVIDLDQNPKNPNSILKKRRVLEDRTGTRSRIRIHATKALSLFRHSDSVSESESESESAWLDSIDSSVTRLRVQDFFDLTELELELERPPTPGH